MSAMWIRRRKRLQLEKKKKQQQQQQISPPATRSKMSSGERVVSKFCARQYSFAKKAVLRGETRARSGVSLTFCFLLQPSQKKFFFSSSVNLKVKNMWPWLQMKNSSFPQPQQATPTRSLCHTLSNKVVVSTVDMTWLIKQGNFIWREQTGWPEENVSDLCLCITSRKFKTFQGSTRKVPRYCYWCLQVHSWFES